jgi:hypothetical protein
MNHGKTITTQSYYDGVITGTKQELEVSLFTDKATLLKDLIDALAVITRGETSKLTLEICVDSKGRYRLVKRWAVD